MNECVICDRDISFLRKLYCKIFNSKWIPREQFCSFKCNRIGLDKLLVEVEKQNE